MLTLTIAARMRQIASEALQDSPSHVPCNILTETRGTVDRCQKKSRNNGQSWSTINLCDGRLSTTADPSEEALLSQAVIVV